MEGVTQGVKDQRGSERLRAVRSEDPTSQYVLRATSESQGTHARVRIVRVWTDATVSKRQVMAPTGMSP